MGSFTRMTNADGPMHQSFNATLIAMYFCLKMHLRGQRPKKASSD